MPISVRIPTPLRKLTKEKDTVQATGQTVREIVDNLEAQFPGLMERQCDEKGELRRFVNVYVNNVDIRFAQGKLTPVKEGDELSIIPAIGGGEDEMAKETKRLWLTYPKKAIRRPVIYELGHKYAVVTNIRQASVTEEVGIVSLELAGKQPEIKKAIKWLERLGIQVEPVEINISEG